MARTQDRVGPLLLISAGAAALIVTAPALGETPARVRGTITEIDDGSITLKEQDGRVITLKTGAYTTYADVVPSSVEEIKVNDFVEAAVKGPSTALVAVELAIVPDNMRAGRISFYGWDPLPDPTAVQTVRGATRTRGPIHRRSIEVAAHDSLHRVCKSWLRVNIATGRCQVRLGSTERRCLAASHPVDHLVRFPRVVTRELKNWRMTRSEGLAERRLCARSGRS